LHYHDNNDDNHHRSEPLIIDDDDDDDDSDCKGTIKVHSVRLTLQMPGVYRCARSSSRVGASDSTPDVHIGCAYDVRYVCANEAA